MFSFVNLSLLIVVMLCTFEFADSGLWSWLFSSKSNNNVGKTNAPTNTDTLGALIHSDSVIPFEMTSEDEKFLAEAKNAMQLSELDSCHHKIILELQSACSHMSEDDIAKMGVALLNCQSVAEGRKTYRCSRDMSLQDCTINMDPNTWNAYHIVSNRARAVCYVVRQHQFQLKTEFAVNKLVHATQGQIHAMSNLKEEQQEIGRSAAATRETIEQSYQQLLLGQHHVQSRVSNNLRDLTREKSLIAAGHKELAMLADEIKDKLDIATQELQSQDADRKNSHKEILSDLAGVRTKAKDVWDKIDESARHVKRYRAETERHYRRTLDDLRRFNNTVAYLLAIVNDTRRAVDAQLGWLIHAVGTTEDSVAALSTCALHVCYFLLVAVSASLLQTPILSRVVCLLLVPLNAAAELKHKSSLGFSAMTLFIALTVLANWFVKFLMSIAWWISHRKSTFFPADGADTNRHMESMNMLRVNRTKLDDTNSSLLIGMEKHVEKSPTGLSAVQDISTVGRLQRSPSLPALLDCSELTSTPPPTPSTGIDICFTDSEMGDTPKPTAVSFMEKLANASFSSTPLKPAAAKRHLLESLERSLFAENVAGRVKRRSVGRSLSMSAVRSPSRSSITGIPRVHCSATTKAGAPCKLLAVSGKERCFHHIRDHE